MESKKFTQFKNEWDNVELLKVFEIPVIDKMTNEQTFIICDISIVGRSFIAQYVGLTKKQEKSKKIACTKITIDPDFSLDENLQELYSACIEAICESEFFELSE